MKKSKKIVLGSVFSACLILVCGLGVMGIGAAMAEESGENAIGFPKQPDSSEAYIAESVTLGSATSSLLNFSINDIKVPEQNLEGYPDLMSWFAALKEVKAEGVGLEDQIISDVGEYLSEEQKAFVRDYCNTILNGSTIEKINIAKTELGKVYTAGLEMKAEAEAITQSPILDSATGGTGGAFYDQVAQSGVLTKSGGINYYNGRKETWYSSNVLYHYKTPEWTCGSDGVWRDPEGYVVVAASDLPQGSIVDTSYGPGRVLDSGCAPGTSDIYVSW